MDPIEKVAHAFMAELCKIDGNEMTEDDWAEAKAGPAFGLALNGGRAAYLAVLEHLAEPSEAMVEASNTPGMQKVNGLIHLAYIHGGEPLPSDPPPLVEAFRAMIAAARKEVSDA